MQNNLFISDIYLDHILDSRENYLVTSGEKCYWEKNLIVVIINCGTFVVICANTCIYNNSYEFFNSLRWNVWVCDKSESLRTTQKNIANVIFIKQKFLKCNPWDINTEEITINLRINQIWTNLNTEMKCPSQCLWWLQPCMSIWIKVWCISAVECD